MAQVTYQDKDTTSPQDDPRRRWLAEDANEVKTAVNSKVDKPDDPQEGDFLQYQNGVWVSVTPEQLANILAPFFL